MKAVAFAVPGDLFTPTGGYTYDRRIIDELPAHGWTVDALDIGDDFPHPKEETRAKARACLNGVPIGRPIVVDGLAFGVMQNEAKELRACHALVALVHHPLAFETGLSAVESEALRSSERIALDNAHRVVVTSPATARLLVEHYGVAGDKITVVQPGTDRANCGGRQVQDDGIVALLSVGTVVPRKGYDVLVRALARLRELPWNLTVVGDRGRSPETARQLDGEIARFDLGERIAFAGAVAPDLLPAFYAKADLFVLPSRFEGYGMAYAEAISHGLPVVATNAAAIPDTVPRGAGVLVPPDDVEALATVLRGLIASPGERMKLAVAARSSADSFPTWHEQASLFARVLDGLG